EVGVGRNDKARRNGKARGLDLMERRSLPAGRYGIKVRVSQKGQSDCVFCCRGFHALTLADSPTQVLDRLPSEAVTKPRRRERIAVILSNEVALVSAEPSKAHSGAPVVPKRL